MKLSVSLALMALLTCASCARGGRANALIAANAPKAKNNTLPPLMKRQVLNAIDAGDGDYRTRLLREKMAAEPENLQVRLDLAESYAQRGFPEVSLEHYRLAAERFPNSADVQVRLARSLRGQHEQKTAILYLTRFLASHEKTPELLTMLGILQDDQRKYKEAEEAYRSAIVLAPNQDSLHNNLGYNLKLQGKAPEAAACFRKALELNPKSETARNNLGELLKSNPDAAVGALKGATDPATAHNNLGAYYIQQGDYAAARKELEMALSYRRDLPQVLSNLKLVSEMDGQSIALPNRHGGSVWRNFTGAFKEAFIEPDFKDSRIKESNGAAETASR
jgi:Flp pilus assembly protein TadD